MMTKRNKGLVKIIVLLEIACLIPISFGLYRTYENRVSIYQQKLAEEEAARKREEARLKELQQREQRQKKLKQWNLILVNPQHAMPDDFAIETAEVERGYVVDKRICDALKEMLADCRNAGFAPQIISTFRTRETQQYLYDRTTNKANTAVPGHSEHEVGLAADIIDASSLSLGDPLVEKQAETPTQKWLMEHCQDYGFILRYPKGKQEVTGIVYEPWHYRYVGKKHAAEIIAKGVCLEEYIENY